MKQHEGWRLVRLSDACELNPRLSSDERPPADSQVTFVPMSAVNEVMGTIAAPQTRLYSDVAKGYTSFKDGDILFAKVTPCMENGKVAIARGLKNGLGFGSTEFHILRAMPGVLPEFLFYVLRQPSFRERAAAAFVGTGGLQRVPADFFSRIRLPFPPAAEQRRIVEILQKAEGIIGAKRSSADHIDELISAVYWEHFGEFYTANGLRDSVLIADLLADTRYGVGEPMGDTGEFAVLRISNVTASGWIDLRDLKRAALTDKEAASTALRDGDLLFNRTNSKELVGKCALWRDRPGRFSFASYLVRLRFKQEVMPEYLWGTLNSAYGKYRLLNAAKPSISMANISPTDLGRIRVPLPPFERQMRFARLAREIETSRARLLGTFDQYDSLRDMLGEQALAGNLTALWRERHRGELLRADHKQTARVTEHTALERRTDIPRPARRTIIDTLSSFQREVWHMLLNVWRGSLLADDPSVFGDFCTGPQMTWRMEHVAPLSDEVRRALEQLAALGLIAKVSLPHDEAKTRETCYLTTFRPLRDEEETRLADVARLARALDGSGGGEGAT